MALSQRMFTVMDANAIQTLYEQIRIARKTADNAQGLAERACQELDVILATLKTNTDAHPLLSTPFNDDTASVEGPMCAYDRMSCASSSGCHNERVFAPPHSNLYDDYVPSGGFGHLKFHAVMIVLLLMVPYRDMFLMGPVAAFVSDALCMCLFLSLACFVLRTVAAVLCVVFCGYQGA